MLVNEIGEKQCLEILARAEIGRLGCALDNQPYVLPVYFAYEPGYIYMFSTVGKKIEWMRENPKVCLEVDEISSQTQWTTVVANGQYEELVEPQFELERAHARKLLQHRHHFWLNAVAERRNTLGDESIAILFFRIRIESVTGLHGQPEGGN